MLNKKNRFIVYLFFVFLVSCSRHDVQIYTTDLPTATARMVEFNFPATQFAREAEATVDSRSVISTQETQALETQAALQQIDQATNTAITFSQATNEALPMFKRIEELYSNGILTSTQGAYYQLPDFTANWAMKGNYDILLTEHTISDFVVLSNSEWESAGDVIKYSNAGCGFVFRLNARGDHYLIFPGSDGVAYLYLVKNHQLELLDFGRFRDTISVSGSARLLVAAQGERITLFVNDTQIIQTKDHSLSAGFLGYSIASGTNKDFGTSCRMTENILWKIDNP